MRKDPVTPAMAQIVARRDEYRCIAPMVDGMAGWCHDRWGNIITSWSRTRLEPDKVTIAHVKGAGEQQMGKRAKSDDEHLVILCWGHHEGAGEKAGRCWGTSRDALEKQRRYLAQFNPESSRTPRL